MMTEVRGIKYIRLQELARQDLEKNPSLSMVDALMEALKTQLIVERACYLHGIGELEVVQDNWGEFSFKFKPSREFVKELKEI